MPSYPEHEKLQAVKERSQAIGEFLAWMQSEKGVVLVERHEHTEEGCGSVRWPECGFTTHQPYRYNVTRLLAEYFGIDLEKLEDEKQAMLDELRQPRRGRRP